MGWLASAPGRTASLPAFPGQGGRHPGSVGSLGCGLMRSRGIVVPSALGKLPAIFQSALEYIQTALERFQNESNEGVHMSGFVMKSLAGAVLAACAGSAAAGALDFSGYFRSGAGTSSK